jgi:hypothetical protein
MQLRPVVFNYIQHPDKKQYGLIAEEVEEVFPELVVRDSNDEVYTVNYQLLLALLLHEIQRQSSELDARKVEQQEMADLIVEQSDTIKEFVTRVVALEKAVKRLQ